MISTISPEKKRVLVVAKYTVMFSIILAAYLFCVVQQVVYSGLINILKNQNSDTSITKLGGTAVG